jgi:acetate kinase
MHILVLNPGSSSIKFSMYVEDGGEFRPLYEGQFSGIGDISAALEFRDAQGKDLSGEAGGVQGTSMQDAIGTVERDVGLHGLPPPDAVGYRVVHYGAHLRGHQRLTPEVLAKLREAIPFAPLHLPSSLEIIDEMMRRFPRIPHFACFDTVFHETMPEVASVYPILASAREAGVRRYGFHGLSCESIVVQMRAAGGIVFPRRMAIAHLGSGCSVTACVEGKSVDTTMGLTPTGGVVMGTRTGDLDPGVVFYLLRLEGATVDSVEAMLSHEAGLKALGGVNDMRELRKAAGNGDEQARLAIRVFCRGVIKAIAGFVALYGADALVFTGGIGEHDEQSRGEISGGLNGIGVELDFAANQLEHSESGQSVRKISDEDSPIAVYVAPAQEDLMIARHVARMCRVSPQAEAQSS